MGATVFIESNFLLELVFRQEQYRACQKLLAAAKASQIRLRLPAFCLMEAVFTLDGRSKDRKSLNRSLTNELTQFGREETEFNEVPDIISALNTLLITRSAVQQEQLIVLVDEVMAARTELIPLDNAVWQQLTNALSTTDLKIGDALVYGSICQSLISEPPNGTAILVTRDTDFKEASIRAQLKGLNCDVLFDFNAALARLAIIE